MLFLKNCLWIMELGLIANIILLVLSFQTNNLNPLILSIVMFATIKYMSNQFEPSSTEDENQGSKHRLRNLACGPNNYNNCGTLDCALTDCDLIDCDDLGCDNFECIDVGCDSIDCFDVGCDALDILDCG